MLHLRRSLSRQAFDHALVRGVVLVPEETGWELNDVLRQPEFENYVREEDRYRLTRRGQLLTAAVSAARSATLKDLFAKAA